MHAQNNHLLTDSKDDLPQIIPITPKKINTSTPSGIEEKKTPTKIDTVLANDIIEQTQSMQKKNTVLKDITTARNEIEIKKEWGNFEKKRTQFATSGLITYTQIPEEKAKISFIKNTTRITILLFLIGGIIALVLAIILRPTPIVVQDTITSFQNKLLPIIDPEYIHYVEFSNTTPKESFIKNFSLPFKDGITEHVYILNKDVTHVANFSQIAPLLFPTAQHASDLFSQVTSHTLATDVYGDERTFILTVRIPQTQKNIFSLSETETHFITDFATLLPDYFQDDSEVSTRSPFTPIILYNKEAKIYPGKVGSILYYFFNNDILVLIAGDITITKKINDLLASSQSVK